MMRTMLVGRLQQIQRKNSKVMVFWSSMIFIGKNTALTIPMKIIDDCSIYSSISIVTYRSNVS